MVGWYGYVMFVEVVYEFVFVLVEMLIIGMGNKWLKRVFYFDNGSMGVEVGVKMVLGVVRVRYGWVGEEKVGVIGFKGSYYGDIIGVMDCSELGVFNEKVEWYEGKGVWLGSLGVRCEKGVWVVEGGGEFKMLGDVFDVEGWEKRGEGRGYEKEIRGVLEKLVGEEGKKFGVLILELVVLGVGGMYLV